MWKVYQLTKLRANEEIPCRGHFQGHKSELSDTIDTQVTLDRGNGISTGPKLLSTGSRVCSRYTRSTASSHWATDMEAFLFFLFENINHDDLRGDKVWQQKAAVDEFSSQSCQQILIYTGQVGIGLIAMVTGHVRVPSHHGRELMLLCSACSFFHPN